MSEILDSDVQVEKIIKPESIRDGRVMASSSDRFLGHLIDMLCVFPIFLSYVFLMEYLFGEIEEGEFFRQPIWFGIYVLLMFLVENFFLKTPGKIARNTIVVNYDGNRPTTSSILIRSLCRIIPFDSMSFLGSTSGWHDTISKTYVVYKD